MNVEGDTSEIVEGKIGEEFGIFFIILLWGNPEF